MAIRETARPTDLSSEDKKEPIMVLIQTKEIKKYVKKGSVMQHNMIKLYGLIWVQCSPSLQRKMGGDPVYMTHAPTYDYLWLFKK